MWKGRAQAMAGDMTGAADFASGKGHRDENFPSPPAWSGRSCGRRSWPSIVSRGRRTMWRIMPGRRPRKNWSKLARMEAGLRGQAGANPEGESLHAVLRPVA